MSKQQSDVRKNVNRLDIFYCDPGDYPNTNTLGGRRPYLILSAFSSMLSNSHLAAPLRSDKGLNADETNAEECVDIRRKTGRYYIPIRIDKKTSFIDLTQIRQIDSRIIDRYIGTIYNEELIKQVNDGIMEIFFGTNQHAIQSEEDNYEPVDISMEVELKPIENDYNVGNEISDTISEQAKHNEEKVIELYKQVKRKELSKSTAARKLGLTIKAFDEITKEIRKEEKEEKKAKSNYAKRPLPKSLPSGFSMYYKAYKENKMTAKQIGEKLKKSDQTIYNYIARYEQLQEENKNVVTL